VLANRKKVCYTEEKHTKRGVFMKLKEGFILQEVAGETVVLPVGEQLDMNMMITLNESGAFLWKQLEQAAEELHFAGVTREELVERLQKGAAE
jgi:hypothetical protein